MRQSKVSPVERIQIICVNKRQSRGTIKLSDTFFCFNKCIRFPILISDFRFVIYHKVYKLVRQIHLHFSVLPNHCSVQVVIFLPPSVMLLYFSSSLCCSSICLLNSFTLLFRLSYFVRAVSRFLFVAFKS